MRPRRRARLPARPVSPARVRAIPDFCPIRLSGTTDNRRTAGFSDPGTAHGLRPASALEAPARFGLRKGTMSGRLLCCLLLTAACGLPRTVSAQAMPWNQGTGTLKLEVPASAANAPGDPRGATSYPQWGHPPYSGGGMWANDHVDGNVYGYGQPGHHGYPDYYGYPPGSGANVPGPLPGVGYAPQQSPQYMTPDGRAPGFRGPQTRYELLPEDRGLLYDEDINWLKNARDKSRGSWVRMEYLDWHMDNPGTTLLGAPVAGLRNPRERFVVQGFDATGNLTVVGQAVVPDMSPVDLQHMPGGRLSFGVPWDGAEFNGVFWGLSSAARFGAPELNVPLNSVPVNPNALFYATSLLDDGTPSSLLILYDKSFHVEYDISTFGGEANLAYDMRNPIDGWQLQGLVGFRHTSHLEELTQSGQFDNRSQLDPTAGQLADPDTNQIFSDTENRLYQLQFGFKTEIANKYFAIGAMPKVAFGTNHYTAGVRTSNLRDSTLDPQQDDGIVTSGVKKSVFSPTVDLGAYIRWNVKDWCALHVGYSFIWMGGIARADEVLYYDDLGLARPPAVRVRSNEESLWMQGISVGGQLTFPRR